MLKLDDGLTIQVSWKGQPIELKCFTAGQVEKLQGQMKAISDKEDTSEAFSLMKDILVEAGLNREIIDQLTMKKINELIEELSGSKKN